MWMSPDSSQLDTLARENTGRAGRRGRYNRTRPAMPEDAAIDPGGSPRSQAADSTLQLLALARAGDRGALDRLFARYGPELQRFARGRLPKWARDITDTPDLV